MLTKKVERDERTEFIENKSYKFGYMMFNFGLLIDVIYRSIVLNEASWDLMGLVIVVGLITTIYQYKQKIFPPAWRKQMLILAVVTAIMAAITAFLVSGVIK